MTLFLALSLVGAWRPGAPMPAPTYGFACAAVGNRIYAIGGLSDRQGLASPTDQVQVYDIDRDTWLKGFSPLPRARGFPGCAALDGKIYVIGGTDMMYEYRRVDRYDPARDVWDTVASLPWSRQGLGACEFQGRIYAIGGYNSFAGGHFYRTVACFVPDSGPGHWNVVDSMAIGRTGLGVAVAGDRIYAVGGWFYGSLSSAEYYTPNQWNPARQSMRVDRYGLAVAGSGRFLCAIGGRNHMDPLTTVEVFDDSLGEWQEAASMSSPRAYLGVAIVGNAVYAIGGQDNHGTIGTVEIGSAPTGIEETPTPEKKAPAEPAGVFKTRIKLNAGTGLRIEIHDNAGKLVVAGRGAVDTELPEGVYFARVESADGTYVTGKVVVVR